MDESKVVRVVGMSSAVLYDKNDPFNPINRRISIIVMNKEAELAAQHDGGQVELDAETEIGQKTAGASGVPAAPAAVAPTAPAAH
jgi:chemotaxis protein MotB